LELGFLLLAALSSAVGLALRAAVSVAVARAFLALGLAALIAGLGTLGLTAWGLSPVGSLTGGLIAAVLIGIGGLVVPFALAVSWGRS
jgi:hypothetical protein